MKDLLQALSTITVLKDEPLNKYTFTKTGGPADFLIFPKNKQEVQAVVQYANAHEIPWLVLGNASNLIVRDGGIRGIVMMLTELDALEAHGTTLYAGAGAKLIDLSYFALQQRLTGLEFSCGIPGSVGGALFMNAGAYDGEIANVVAHVEVLKPDGTFATYENSELAFSYRHSLVQETGDIILGGYFQLACGDVDAIKFRMEELTKVRQEKQPLEYPSCGSVFKRPEGHYTGKLIQDAGLQGLKWGGAQISEKHAGFIVNIDHATATDYLELIAHIQQVIWNKFQVRLETEVRILGEEV